METLKNAQNTKKYIAIVEGKGLALGQVVEYNPKHVESILKRKIIELFDAKKHSDLVKDLADANRKKSEANERTIDKIEERLGVKLKRVTKKKKTA